MSRPVPVKPVRQLPPGGPWMPDDPREKTLLEGGLVRIGHGPHGCSVVVFVQAGDAIVCPEDPAAPVPARAISCYRMPEDYHHAEFAALAVARDPAGELARRGFPTRGWFTPDPRVPSPLKPAAAKPRRPAAQKTGRAPRRVRA